jgi:hypothetical protein
MAKDMSGGGVKASPRQPKESPQELKTREGIEWSEGLNRRSAATNRCPDQRPEGRAGGIGSGGVTHRERKPANDKRVRLADEARRLGSGNKPLRCESRTWQ